MELNIENLTSFHTENLEIHEHPSLRTFIPHDSRDVVTPVKRTTLSPVQKKIIVVHVGNKEMTPVNDCEDIYSNEGRGVKRWHPLKSPLRGVNIRFTKHGQRWQLIKTKCQSEGYHQTRCPRSLWPEDLILQLLM